MALILPRRKEPRWIGDFLFIYSLFYVLGNGSKMAPTTIDVTVIFMFYTFFLSSGKVQVLFLAFRLVSFSLSGVLAWLSLLDD